MENKTAFNLGWDCYIYNIHLPELAKEEINKIVINGFDAAKSKNVTKIKPDRYIRKWIQIRSNALKRRRYFDESVTPHYIRSIDVIKCPITNVMLTHSTGKYSDWSIDRINNNASYTKGNLVVVSSRANIAKSNYSHYDMVNFAYGTDGKLPENCDYRDDIEPLNKLEWARWVAVSGHAIIDDTNEREKIASSICPCVCAPIIGLTARCDTMIQYAIANKAMGYEASLYSHIQASLTEVHKTELSRILKKAKNTLTHKTKYDIWYNQILFIKFYNFYQSLSENEKESIMSATRKLSMVRTGGVNMDSFKIEEKGFAT